MKIIACAYRDWGLKIIESISGPVTLIKSKEEYDTYFSTYTHDADLIFFFGWSWIIPADVVNNNICIGLHPSPLPKYRGGSPIQNQIIAGETTSAVSLFILTEKLDKGDVIYQKEFSLDGDLNDIFDRIVTTATTGIDHILSTYRTKKSFDIVEQRENESSYFKRRTPQQSEIKIEDFENYTAEELYNKIRALQDPYPNAFITCKDGTKLYLTKSYANIL